MVSFMTNEQQVAEQLSALATRLSARREAILQAWARAVEKDPALSVSHALSRQQFYDHIPEVLQAFDRRLRARNGSEETQATEDHYQTAAEHGLVRWQQGYQLLEVMRDWGHLSLCLVDELECDAIGHPELAPEAIWAACRAATQLCAEGATASAVQYARLTQAEAASRVADLSQALARLSELERQRAEVWREAAHDLRGNVGVVKNAALVLNHAELPEPRRARSLAILQKGVNSLQVLLNDLLDLSRLEAGQDQRKVEPFDAAALLEELCANMQSVAAERGLFLKAEGPASLPVEGDAIKTRRIAQNLLLNALQYTEHGGVKVIWAHGTEPDPERWTVCIQDTGPGFDDGAVPPLAEALKAATEEVQKVGESGNSQPAPTLDSQSVHRRQGAGEGIGLSIVKRLCELLDASLELETQPGQGSTFRVKLPLRYNSPAR
jgi:signal transduction histidine kinase